MASRRAPSIEPSGAEDRLALRHSSNTWGWARPRRSPVWRFGGLRAARYRTSRMSAQINLSKLKNSPRITLGLSAYHFVWEARNRMLQSCQVEPLRTQARTGSRSAMKSMSRTHSKRLILLVLYLFCCVPLGFARERHTAFGVVLEVDRTPPSIRVSCHEIPGYMEAMVMEFPVQNVMDLEGLEPGTLIDFTIVVAKDSAHAEGIRIHPFQSTDPEPMAVRQLNLLEGLVGRSSDATKKINIGEHVPDFSLIDQNSQSVSLASFTGKVV